MKYYETPFSASILCPMTHTLMIIDWANYAESWLPRIDPWALQPEYKIFLISPFCPNTGFTKIRHIVTYDLSLSSKALQKFLN